MVIPQDPQTMFFNGNSQFGKIKSANVHDRDTTLPVITNFGSNTDGISTVLHVSPHVPEIRVPGIQRSTKNTQKRKSTTENTVAKRKKERGENCIKTMQSKTYF